MRCYDFDAEIFLCLVLRVGIGERVKERPSPLEYFIHYENCKEHKEEFDRLAYTGVPSRNFAKVFSEGLKKIVAAAEEFR